MTPRQAEDGVTLIEMLAALTIAALIGVAGFTLLDGVATRDAQLGGRIDLIRDRDRAFQLLSLDATRARRASLTAETGLTLWTSRQRINWRADDAGVTRRIIWQDGRTVTQQVLRERADLTAHPTAARAVLLRLPEPDIAWISLLPQGLTP